MTEKAAGGEELMTTHRANAPRLSGRAALGALGALERSVMSLSRVFTERRRVFYTSASDKLDPISTDHSRSITAIGGVVVFDAL